MAGQFYAYNFFKPGFWATGFWANTVPATQSNDAGSSKGSSKRRRKFILPDGRMIEATYREVYDILQSAVVVDGARLDERKERGVEAKPEGKKMVEAIDKAVLIRPFPSDRSIMKINMKENAVWKPKKGLFDGLIFNDDDDDEEVMMITLH